VEGLFNVRVLNCLLLNREIVLINALKALALIVSICDLHVIVN
jgi:hypothetical protein